MLKTKLLASNLRILYAAGPGNAVQASKDWNRKIVTPFEVSLTISGQVLNLCSELNCNLLMVSSNTSREDHVFGKFVVANRPKWCGDCTGFSWHIVQLIYAIRVLIWAIKFRADLIIVDSGTTHWFLMSPASWFGIRVVAVLHNAIWPVGFRKTSYLNQFQDLLNGWFFRKSASAVIGVSKTCLDQVRELMGPDYSTLLLEAKYQFNMEGFDSIQTPPESSFPFRLLFAGRMNRSKGVYDLLEIAERLEKSCPSRFLWELCGDGPDLTQIREEVKSRKLHGCVSVLGRMDRIGMISAYGRCHCLIVPTRADSGFCEGLPMVVSEAMLSGRPAIVSRVANASDSVGPAILEVTPHCIEEYIGSILKLADDRKLYEAMCSATTRLGYQFVDGRMGFTPILFNALLGIGMIESDIKSTATVTPKPKHRQ